MPRYHTDEDYEATKFLGGMIGAKFPLLKNMAMMSQHERELYGDLESLKKIITGLGEKKTFVKDRKTKKKKAKITKGILLSIIEKDGNISDKEIIQFLGFTQEIIQLQGLAKYKQTEVSHLSMKLGSTKKRYTGKLPTFE